MNRYHIPRRAAALLLTVCLMLTLLPTALAAEDTVANEGEEEIAGYTDIPQVYITTENEIVQGSYVGATIEIEDPSGTYETISDTEAKIKIRGNSTAEADKKPYNIKFSEKTSVLGMGKGKKYCLLANRFDKSLMRNRLVYDLAKQMNFAYVPETAYADVWLNGEYQGNYLITTPVETGSNRLDIDTNETNNTFLLEVEQNEKTEDGVTYVQSPGGIRLAVGEPEEPTEAQVTYLNEFLTELETALDGGDYTAVQELVDIDSIIDLYLLNELTHNVDVHYSSTRFYIENGKLYAGPPWDFDLSMGNLNVNWYGEVAYRTDTVYATTSGWIAKLMQYEDFRTAFVARYDELYTAFENLYQDNELGTNRISQLYTTYQNAFEREGTVWDFVKSSNWEREPDADLETNVEFLRSWLKAHNEWLRDNLEQAICPHSFEDYVYNDDATCTADGTETAVCEYGCGTTDTRTKAGTKIEHSFESYTYNNDATCTADGTETAACANGCGTTDTRAKTGTMTEHSWDEGTVTQEPTETQMGERQYTCTACGAVKTEEFVAFSDVGERYYADAVDWAAAQGITTGTTPVSFEPEKGCTRAEIVTFLYRTAGSPAVEGDSGFTDVAESAYYADTVAWAVQQGITEGTAAANGVTQGTSAATFAPKAACTRAQIVTMQYRFAALAA